MTKTPWKDHSAPSSQSLASLANMNNYQKLKEIDCPITKVVLFTVMGTVLTKKTKVDPKASLYQSDRRKSLFSDDKEQAALEKRCSKLVSAITSYILRGLPLLDLWVHSDETNL